MLYFCYVYCSVTGRALTNSQRNRRVHELTVAGLAALCVNVHTQRLEDKEELAAFTQLNGAQCVHSAAREEAQQLVVRVHES